jgi:ATP-dependent Clp protease ATP-binding subunit ClpC
MHDKYLPAKAVELLELVSVKVAESKGKGAMVTKNDIAEVVSKATNIPVSKVTDEESEVLLNMEEKIHERMINQEEAVDMVASSLRRARSELTENKRPIASFLFLGPTGVGKTELAKTVTDIYFGSEKNMIRVDMSEYQHPDSIKKMIGSAEGVRGYLTEAVRKAPFSLILLDEFEKAHPDILNLFLQVMDDGRLTDGQGRTIDFTNSIIISTSNADAVYIQDEVAKRTAIEKIKEVIINERLNKILRPELINRFDGIIVFKPLSEENVVDITRLMLAKIEKTLEKKGIRMRAEEEGIRALAYQGYDPKFGARPMRRLLQDRIENIIANKILSSELQRRDTVVIDANAEVRVEKRKKL